MFGINELYNVKNKRIYYQRMNWIWLVINQIGTIYRIFELCEFWVYSCFVSVHCVYILDIIKIVAVYLCVFISHQTKLFQAYPTHKQQYSVRHKGCFLTNAMNFIEINSNQFNSIQLHWALLGPRRMYWPPQKYIELRGATFN